MNAEDYEQIIAKAQKNVEQGNYREAQVLLEEFLKQEDWLSDELQAKAFLWLGRVGLHRGNFNEALLHLKTAQTKANLAGHSWVLLEAIRVEGVLQSEKGNFEDALECFKSALGLARQLNMKKSIASCLNNIALIYEYRGELDKALEIFDESLAIAVEAEDKQESSKALNNMAEVFAKKGQYDLAYENYRRSLVLDKERGDKAGEAIGLNNIAEIYKARGDYDKSIKYLQEAYDLVEETDSKPMLAVILSNLGELHWLEGDLRKATEVLEAGLNICNEVGIEDESYWRMLLLLAGVQTDRGGEENYQRAEVLLATCEALNERIQSKLLEAEINYVRGYLEAPETGRGNLGNAKRAYNNALELAENEKLGFTEIWINASLGLAHTLLGDYLATFDEVKLEEAEQRLQKILEKARLETQVPILTKVLELQGLLALAQMKHDEALTKFDKARQIAKSRGLTYLADKVAEQYEKAVQLRAKSQRILAKDSDSVQDVIQYVKDRVREVQRMIQTYGGG